MMRIRICLAFDWELVLYIIHVYIRISVLGCGNNIAYSILLIFSEREHGHEAKA